MMMSSEESLEAEVVSRPQQTVKKTASKDVKNEECSSSDDDDIKIDKVIKVTSTKPSNIKVAPIFQIGKSSSKAKSTCGTKITEEDPAKLAARKAFLLSSVPESLKDRVHRLKIAEDLNESWVTPFASKIGHVRQLSSDYKNNEIINNENRPQNIELKWQKIDKKRLEVLQPPTEEPCGDVNPPLSMKGYHGTMIGEALTQKKDKGISSYVQDECC